MSLVLLQQALGYCVLFVKLSTIIPILLAKKLKFRKAGRVTQVFIVGYDTALHGEKISEKVTQLLV